MAELKSWLVFLPLVHPSGVVLGLTIVGHVKAVNGEHAIRVARTKGIADYPIVEEKRSAHFADARKRRQERFLRMGVEGDLPITPRRSPYRTSSTKSQRRVENPVR